MLPYFIFGQNMYIRLNDNLDSEFVWRVLLVRNHAVLNSNAIISQIMNGLPRYMLPSGLNFQFVFYIFLKPYYAYVSNEFFLRILAFVGMWILLRTHFSTNRKYCAPIFLVSTCFALLPFYSSYGLTVFGQPLLLNAFLNIRQNKTSLYNYATFFLFSFYSNFVLVGIFILLVLLITFCFEWIKYKRFHLRFLSSIFLLTSGYFISEYNLILQFLKTNIPLTQRSVYDLKYLSYPLNSMFGWFREYFFIGQPHAISCHLFILFLTSFTLFKVFFQKKYIDSNKELKIISILFLLLMLISFSASFYLWENFDILKEQCNLLKMFQLDRFYFFLPLLWFLLFYQTLRIIQKLYVKPKFLLLLVFLLKFLFNPSTFKMKRFGSM
jgi:hypothetical protein